jgi:hypothetical protein
MGEPERLPSYAAWLAAAFASAWLYGWVSG